jgi:hypothetical protein
MTAAFLYCDGYRETISLMSSWFCAVNSKGILALFSGVSRCCKPCQRLQWQARGRQGGMLPTTKSESLRAGRDTLNARHWARWNWREARGTLLNMKGTSFEAMVVALRTAAMAYAEYVDVNDGAHPKFLALTPPNHRPIRAARNHICQNAPSRFHLNKPFAAKPHAVIHIGR